MSLIVSLLFFFFFLSHFLFSLFVLFLHVQFCKANSRYCISQLVSLQRKFTVSCSLLRYSVNGFMISIFINLPLPPPPPSSWRLHSPPFFFQKSFPSLWKASRPTYGGRTGKCATLPYNACDLIVSNSVVFCILTVSFPPPFLCPPVPLIISLCCFLNYLPCSLPCPRLMVHLILTCTFVLCLLCTGLMALMFHQCLHFRVQ